MILRTSFAQAVCQSRHVDHVFNDRSITYFHIIIIIIIMRGFKEANAQMRSSCDHHLKFGQGHEWVRK